MEWILPVLGGLGIGSVLTKIVDHYLIYNTSKKDKIYNEKKEAYLELLKSLRDAKLNTGKKELLNYALCQARIDVFGSKLVAELAQKMTGEIPQDPIYENLIEEMRKDIKKSL